MWNSTQHRVVVINSEIIDVSVECVTAGLRHTGQAIRLCGMRGVRGGHEGSGV